VLVCVDPVESTVDEAVAAGAQLLVAHHPLLLKGVHGVGTDTHKGRLVHRMVRAGLACMIHGVVPAWFTRTGSATVKRLYGEMRDRQPNFRSEAAAFLTPQWQPEYEI